MLGQLWWYLWLGFMAVPMEEAAPLIGGLRAHDGALHFSIVLLSTAAGTWAFGMGGYYLGRWRGHWVRRRYPRVRRVLLVAFKIVRRHPWRAAVAVRFAYGLRVTLPIACGAARLPMSGYALAVAVSSLVWAAIFTTLGWVFGESAQRVLGHVQRNEHWLVLVILVVIVIAWRVMRQRHVENEVVEVLAIGDPGPVPKITD